jgi:tetratricopeptide (TPR) repeat protein
MTLVAVALQIWTFAFVGFFGTELLGTYPELRIAAQILFVVPLLAWAVWRLRGPRTRLDWAVLAGLAVLLVVSVTSHDRQGSLESVGLAIAYALGFWMLTDVAQVPRLRTAMAVGATYALILWLLMADAWWLQEKVAWIQVFGSMPNLESNQVFIWGTTNVFPVLSLLAVPLLRWQPSGTPRRVLVGMWAAASVVAIPLSQGRAGWLGLVAAGIAYEWLSRWRLSRQLITGLRARRLLVPAGAVAGLAVIAGMVLVVSRAGSLLDAALDGRGQLWTQATAIFAASPLVGGGPATYSWLRLEHVPAYTYNVPARLAHSVPLLTLADGGLLLAVGFGALLVTYVATARRLADQPQRRTGLAILIGFAVASCFDDFSSLPAVMGLMVAIAAWTIAPETAAQPGLRAPRPAIRLAALPVAVGIVGVLSLPSVLGVDVARTEAAAGRDAAVAGDWQQAADRFASATSAYGTDAGYWLGLGLADAQLGRTDAARMAYGEARDVSSGDPRGWGGLAALARSPNERQELWAEAAKRSVADPTYALQLGRADIALNRGDDAQRAYGIAVALDRSVIHQFDGDPALRTSVTDAAVAFAAHMGAQAALSPQAVRDDLALAMGASPEGSAWKAIALAKGGDAASANQALAVAEDLDPYSQATVRAAEAVAQLSCDRERYDAISGLAGAFRPAVPAQLTIIRDHTYREDMLSSYLPPAAIPLQPEAAWPWSLIGDPPPCPGWPAAP